MINLIDSNVFSPSHGTRNDTSIERRVTNSIENCSITDNHCSVNTHNVLATHVIFNYFRTFKYSNILMLIKIKCLTTTII